MKIKGKDDLSISRIGDAGGMTKNEFDTDNPGFVKKRDALNKPMRNKSDSANDKPYFRQYPTRVEESGNIRHYIEDTGPDKYFEIFVWLSKKNVLRYDLHYDINKDERMLSWKVNQKGFVHSHINPERSKDFGLKKAQTANGAAEFDKKALKKKFLERYEATKKIKVDKDNELIAILDFISGTLRKL